MEPSSKQCSWDFYKSLLNVNSRLILTKYMSNQATMSRNHKANSQISMFKLLKKLTGNTTQAGKICIFENKSL